MKKLITTMSSNEFFHFFLFFNFCFTSTCAMEVIPIKAQKIIFCYADVESKNNLILTSRFFLGVAQEFAGEKCSFNDFVDKLYSVPIETKFFKLLSNNCPDEHKNSLLNYYFSRGSTLPIIIDNKGNIFTIKNVDKKTMIETCCKNQKFDALFARLIGKGKQDVKYYSDYCNALCSVMLLKRDHENKSEKIFWFNGISLEQLVSRYENIKRDVDDIRIFCGQYDFSKSIDEDFEKKIIDEALRSKKISVLVWLSEWIKEQEKDINDARNKICNIFMNAKTDKLRKILAKSGYTHSLDLVYLLGLRIRDQDCDKVKCYLEILIDQGDMISQKKRCGGIYIKDILKFKSDDILSNLFDLDFKVMSSEIDQIKSLTADEVKRYVKVGYEKYGIDFWARNESCMLLHRAVTLNDVELVNYLLSIGALKNDSLRNTGKKNKEIINFLLQQKIYIENDLFNFFLECNQNEEINKAFINHLDITILMDYSERLQSCLREFSVNVSICIKNTASIMTSKQVEFLLNNIYELYLSYSFKGKILAEEKTRVTCLLNALPLNKADIFDQGNKGLLSMLVELMDEQKIIDYISSRTKMDYWQLKSLLNEALEWQKKEIVCYLFDSEKIGLNSVSSYQSNNENMQAILEEYAQKYKKKNKFALSPAEFKITKAIVFLAEESNNNLQDIYLNDAIKQINIPWIDNIYARCSNGKSEISALEALAKINPNLKELTNEEKQNRGKLEKIIFNGEGFEVNQCGKYLEQIDKIYNRPVADLERKKAIIFALAQQIRNRIGDVFEGLSLNIKNEILIKDVKLLPVSDSNEEKKLFNMFNQLDKINQAQQGNLCNQYKILKQAAISAPKIQLKQEAIPPSKIQRSAINNSTESKNFSVSDMIKNACSSFIKALYYFLCFLNPFRLFIAG